MLNELRERGLAEVHVSLSYLSENGSKMVIFRSINFKSFPANRCNLFGANQFQLQPDFFPDSSGTR
jgi:hypothetical protein